MHHSCVWILKMVLVSKSDKSQKWLLPQASFEVFCTCIMYTKNLFVMQTANNFEQGWVQIGKLVPVPFEFLCSSLLKEAVWSEIRFMLNRKLVDPGESRVLLHLPQPIPRHVLSLYRWSCYITESHKIFQSNSGFCSGKALLDVVNIGEYGYWIKSYEKNKFFFYTHQCWYWHWQGLKAAVRETTTQLKFTSERRHCLWSCWLLAW